MCGIAGRMLMELGFHNGEVSQHLLGSDAQREEAWILTSNIVILDRQWSSATGLPTHFNESSFSPIPLSSVSRPIRTRPSGGKWHANLGTDQKPSCQGHALVHPH